MLNLNTFLPINELLIINIITIFFSSLLLIWSIHLKNFLLYHLQYPKDTNTDTLNQLDLPRVKLAIRSCIIGIWFGMSFFIVCYIAK